MNFLIKLVIIPALFVAVFCDGIVCAQNLKPAAAQNFNITKLTTKDGLSSNTVNLILKDRYGLMWFGTSNGLNKFDGTQLTVYRHNDRDRTSLPGNEILALYEDSRGRLWVG